MGVFTWDDRMIAMQALGDVSLAMEAKFDWRVRHHGVLLLSGMGESEHTSMLIPEGQGTNPYDCVDDHWRQLTEGFQMVRSQKLNGVFAWSTAMKDWFLIPTEQLQAA